MIRTIPTEEEVLASEALARECAKSMVNLYACENVCFGKITQNEKVPIYRYIEDLELLQFYDSAVVRLLCERGAFRARYQDESSA